MWHVSLCIFNSIYMFLMAIEYMQGVLQSLFFQKNIKYEIANINAITNTTVPITNVMLKSVVLDPLLDLHDEWNSKRYGVMWKQFYVSPKTLKNMIILKLKGIKEYAKVEWLSMFYFDLNDMLYFIM